jgi:hypothetical protein
MQTNQMWIKICIITLFVEEQWWCENGKIAKYSKVTKMQHWWWRMRWTWKWETNIASEWWSWKFECRRITKSKKIGIYTVGHPKSQKTKSKIWKTITKILLCKYAQQQQFYNQSAIIGELENIKTQKQYFDIWQNRNPKVVGKRRVTEK